MLTVVIFIPDDFDDDDTYGTRVEYCRHKSVNILQPKADDVAGLRLKPQQYLISEDSRAMNLEL